MRLLGLLVTFALVAVALPAAGDDECLVGFELADAGAVNDAAELCGEAVDKKCTFSLGLCLNDADAACPAGTLNKRKIRARGHCGGVGKLALAPAGTDNVCSSDSGTFARVVVHTKKNGTRVGKCTLRVAGKTADGRQDLDKVKLVCNPQPGSCPSVSTTTTATVVTTTTRPSTTTTVTATTTTIPTTSTTTATTSSTSTTTASTTTTTPSTTTTTSESTTTTVSTSSTTVIGSTTTTESTTTTGSESTTTSTTEPGPACEPIVDDGQGTPGTYQLLSIAGAKICQTNATQNRFMPCTTDADCGGGTGNCAQTPFATADGFVLPFPEGIGTVLTIAAEDPPPPTGLCDHAACISCGNENAACAGISGCGAPPDPPAAGCIRNTCCDEPGFTIPTFLVPILGGLCSRLDMYRCGFGAVNTSNPQMGDNEVTKTADTTDPGPDCEYGTGDDPATKDCNTTATGEGADIKGKVTRVVGDGVADANGIQYRMSVPSLSTTWQDMQSPAGTCVNGSTFENAELLVTQLVLNAEFTTAGATGSFSDLSGEGCARAGAGFTNFNRDGPFTIPAPPASPQPYDGSAGSVAVSAGVALSGGGPLYDIGFLAVLPNAPFTRLPAEACSCAPVPSCPE